MDKMVVETFPLRKKKNSCLIGKIIFSPDMIIIILNNISNEKLQMYQIL